MSQLQVSQRREERTRRENEKNNEAERKHECTKGGDALWHKRPIAPLSKMALLANLHNAVSKNYSLIYHDLN